MSIKKYDAEANFLLFAASILCGKNHVMATRRPHSTFPGAPTTHISCTFVSGKRFSHLRHCFFDLPSRLRSPIEGWARASLRLALAAAGKRSGGLILDRVASGEQLRMQLRRLCQDAPFGERRASAKFGAPARLLRSFFAADPLRSRTWALWFVKSWVCVLGDSTRLCFFRIT